MSQTLVIGFGNLDRGDDGAAFHVVNRLRQRMGRKPLAPDDTGLEDLGRSTAVFIPQLVPELSGDVSGYARIVFVDAHLPGGRQPLQCEPVRPEALRTGFCHALSPGSFLWLVQMLCGRTPEAFVVSLQGHDFEATRRLTPVTAGLVEKAADKVWQLQLLGCNCSTDRTVTEKEVNHDDVHPQHPLCPGDLCQKTAGSRQGGGPVCA